MIKMQHIIIKVNGENKKISSPINLNIFMNKYMYLNSTDGLAIAVNEEIIFRENWGTYMLKDGDSVEVLKAVSGG